MAYFEYYCHSCGELAGRYDNRQLDKLYCDKCEHDLNKEVIKSLVEEAEYDEYGFFKSIKPIQIQTTEEK